MRAKFSCESITIGRYGRQAELRAVGDNSPENNTFSEATPSGTLSIYITAQGAYAYLQVGKSYYLDFTEAPDNS